MGPCSGPARALAETALPVARYCLGVQSTSSARLPVALAQKKAPDRETSVRADGNGKHCRLPQSGPRSREQRLQEPEIETSGPPYHPVYGHLVEILVSVGDFRPKRLLAVEEGEANGRRFPRESSIVYSRINIRRPATDYITIINDLVTNISNKCHVPGGNSPRL